MSDEKDVPGVIVFPPLIPLTVLVVGIVLDRLLPLTVLNGVSPPLRAVAGGILFVFGLWVMVGGRRTFVRAGTNVNPHQPSLKIVSEGIYSHLRNPMYVGATVGLLGIILAFGLEWTFVLLVIGSLILHFGVVLREERYLERKFGDEYLRYKAGVPRYGWKF
jgi:protein-S-isoprenylcysteine O-methyltransferase Ste14